jgi:hypothetical protein
MPKYGTNTPGVNGEQHGLYHPCHPVIVNTGKEIEIYFENSASMNTPATFSISPKIKAEAIEGSFLR